jgi:RNA polymerase sigma factor (sigma-70 family)
MGSSSTPPPPPKPPSKGDQPARLRSAIVKLVRRMRGVPSGDHEDIAQDATIRALRSFSSYDPGRGSLLGWLRIIVRHVAFEAAARKQRQMGLALDEIEDFEEITAGTGPDPEAQLGRAQLQLIARSIVDEIPAPEREVMLLQKNDGMTVEQMAAVLGVPDTTVKGRLVRARRFAAKAVRRWQAARRLNDSDLAALGLLLGSLSEERDAEASPSENVSAPGCMPLRAPLRAPRWLPAKLVPALLCIPALLAIPVALSDLSEQGPSDTEGGIAMSGVPALATQAQALPLSPPQSPVVSPSQQSQQSPSRAGAPRPQPASAPTIGARRIGAVATGTSLSVGPPSSTVSGHGDGAEEWRAAARVLTSLANGHLEEATQRAAAFEGAFPGSAYAPRVRAALQAAQKGAGAPQKGARDPSLGKPALFE